MKLKKKIKNLKKSIAGLAFGREFATILIFLMDLVFFTLLSFLFVDFTVAGIGGNVTVTTLLNVGAVSPEILNLTVFDSDNGINLNANSTRTVYIQVLARDYNGEYNFQNTTSVVFDKFASSYGAVNDNNTHYSNLSCSMDLSYGTAYEINATCAIPVYYYANNATWNASVYVIDNSSRNDTESFAFTVNTLLALGLPGSIDYGTVNETLVSNEKNANVTNFGNVLSNLTLEGYGAQQGDNLSMNCTLGSIQNISIGYERYNLNSSNNSQLNYAQFDLWYLNLTSNRTVKRFNVPQRQSEVSAYLDDTNSTYWRIYVPVGVAGSCTGNIIFGATVGPGT